MRYRDWLKARLNWARRGPWALFEKTSAIVGVGLGIVVIFATDWSKKNLDERMNAALLVFIPIASGFSVFLIRWWLSNWAVFKSTEATLSAKISERDDRITALTAGKSDLRIPQSIIDRRGSKIWALFTFHNAGTLTASRFSLRGMVYFPGKPIWLRADPVEEIHANEDLRIPFDLT